MDIPQTMMNFIEEPEAMHELIDYLTDWELEYADKVCKYLKPDALFHHDDWGTQTSTFISPAMFEEFFLPLIRRFTRDIVTTAWSLLCTTPIPTRQHWYLI